MIQHGPPRGDGTWQGGRLPQQVATAGASTGRCCGMGYLDLNMLMKKQQTTSWEGSKGQIKALTPATATMVRLPGGAMDGLDVPFIRLVARFLAQRGAGRLGHGADRSSYAAAAVKQGYAGDGAQTAALDWVPSNTYGETNQTGIGADSIWRWRWLTLE